MTPIRVVDQADLRAEQASVAADLMQGLRLENGQQVIIGRDAGTFALYTLTDTGTEPARGTVGLGSTGRARLEGPEQFAGFIDPLAVDENATEEAARRGEKLIETLVDGRRPGLVVLAPHGGDVERFTDLQAAHVGYLLSDLGVSCWRCQGWKPGGGAAARWHITSTAISPVSFPRLATIAERGFQHAVSFHGFTDAARPDILVGGAAPEPIKRMIQSGIASSVGLTVEITGPGDPLGGTSEANLVNRLTGDRRHGVQIEQQPHARAGTGTVPGQGRPRWQAIAAAVADVYRAILTA